MSASNVYAMNQFAPASQQGIATPPPTVAGYEDKAAEYVYNPPDGVLTANQEIDPDTVAIQVDADFFMAAWYISKFTGVFQIKLTDASGYQLSNTWVYSSAISQTQSEPTVISPAHFFPAGSKIQIAIKDLSGAENPLQIVFKGWKRFRLETGAAR